MSQWAGGVLTAAGRALQAKVEAGTTALVLTKIKLGDGTESMDAVDNLTDLVGAKAVLGISSSVADGDHATITGVVLSTQLQAGFWAREWGLFATDPDEGEILYMITIDAQPEWLPASTAAAQVSATYAMNIAVANATNIEVQIDPAGLVDVEMLDSYMGLAKRSTACALGDTAMLEGIPAGYFLECTTGGTTGTTAPVITSPVAAGQTISDGTVVWTVRKCFPTSGGYLYGDIRNGRGSTSLLYVSGGSAVNRGGVIKLISDEYDVGGALQSQWELGSFGYIDPDDVSTFFSSYLRGRKTELTWQPDGTNSQYNLGDSSIVAKSLDASGYVKRASGEIVQWGTVNITSASTYTITFPISFTDASSYKIVASACRPTGYPTNINVTLFSNQKTANSVGLVTSEGDGANVDWIAVGY